MNIEKFYSSARRLMEKIDMHKNSIAMLGDKFGTYTEKLKHYKNNELLQKDIDSSCQQVELILSDLLIEMNKNQYDLSLNYLSISKRRDSISSIQN